MPKSLTLHTLTSRGSPFNSGTLGNWEGHRTTQRHAILHCFCSCLQSLFELKDNAQDKSISVEDGRIMIIKYLYYKDRAKEFMLP